MDIDRTIDPYLVDPLLLAEWVKNKPENISQARLGKVLGLDKSTMSRWANGKTSRLYKEQLEAIAQFTQKPLEQVMKLLSAKPIQYQQNSELQQNGEDFVLIPLYSVAAGAGNGSLPGIERVSSVLKFPRSWLKKVLPGMDLDELEAVEVLGDSMPPLKSGDSVIHNPQDIRLQDGIFVIRIDGEVWVKRLSPLPGGRVRISSDNPVYPPIEISQCDLEILGKVVYACFRYG